MAANDPGSADIRKIPDSLHLASLNPEPEDTGRPRSQTLLAIICSFIVAGPLALVFTVPFWVSPESVFAEWIVSVSPGWLFTNRNHWCGVQCKHLRLLLGNSWPHLMD